MKYTVICNLTVGQSRLAAHSLRKIGRRKMSNLTFDKLLLIMCCGLVIYSTVLLSVVFCALMLVIIL